MADRPLVVEGGTPAFPAGPPSWPGHDSEIAEAVQQALLDGTWGVYHGPHCDALCQSLSDMHQLEFVRLCCSGTIGIELALRGVQVTAGDEVVLAGYDFPGNFRAIEAIGALPVLFDLQPATYRPDLDQLESAIGPQTKAVIASHLHGDLAEAPAIRELCDRQGVAFVEDACQSPGATIEQQTCGSFGHVAVHSFGGSKLLTAGRGGAVLTADPAVAQRIKVFSERGNDAFALSELQAASLLPQLSRLAQQNERRLAAVLRLVENWQVPWLSPVPTTSNEDKEPAFYKLGFHFNLDHWPHAKPPCADEVAQLCRSEGIALDRGFRGFARRSARRCRPISDLQQSRHLGENSLILHHPLLLQDSEEIDLARHTIQRVLSWLEAQSK